MSEPSNRTEKPLLFRKLVAASKKEDQRVRRTRDRLGDALVSLLLEQAFDGITVQQVLDRAGVSRSTFHAHYRDKNDPFLSDAEEFFDSMATALSGLGDRSERLVPVHEFFAHVREARSFYDALVSSGRVHEVMELGQEHFARGIEQRLGEIAPVGTFRSRKERRQRGASPAVFSRF